VTAVRSLGSLAVALLMAEPALAQTGPGPAPGPQPPVAVPPAQMPPPVTTAGQSPGSQPVAVEGARVVSRTWAFGLRLQEGWDTNVRLLPVEDEMFVDNVAATLSYQRRGTRGELGFSGRGGAVFYRDDSDLNEFTYTGGMAGAYQLSPRLRGSLSGGVSSAYTHDSAALTNQGLVLPLALARTVSGAGGFSYRMGSRTGLSGTGHYDRVSFRRAGDVADPALTGGELLGGGVSLDSGLSPRDTLSLGYDYQHSDVGEEDGTAHSLSLGWTRALGARISMNLLGGVTRFVLAGQESSDLTPKAAAGLSARLRRSTVSLQYSRRVDQAFGLGRDRLSDVISAAYSLTAGRRLRLAASGTYGFSRDPSDPGFRLRTGYYGGEIGVALARRLDLTGSYLFREREPEGGPSVTGHSAGVSLTFGREWRR
jgi:hypothetical protein